MRKNHLIGSAVVMMALCIDVRSAPAASTCENLATPSLRNTTVTQAQLVAAGAFTPPPPAAGRAGGGGAGPGRGRGQQFADLPAFCRVQATLKPSSDSDIRMELWMPVAASWNGKLRGTGNGGLGGGAGINAGALAAGVRLGYATTGNNTGHEGDSSYALDHPEKIKDFGYRSAHEMTVTARALIKAYYDKDPTYSVMAEGGGGTIAALSSAQRYPGDYDVIAVTGMSSYLTRHTFGQMWYWQATHQDAASYIPPEKSAVLHEAALKACDELDGLKDGIIGDVEHCKFDPGVAQCKGADAPSCLTAPQVEAARKIYAGPRNPRTGQEIYSPMYPGSELGWAQLAGGDAPLGIPVEFFKYYVFKDPNWDYHTRPIDFDKDVALADKPEIQPVNAVNPDLKKFLARGGKLLLVDGWADTSVPPKVAINYYKNVVAKTGASAVKESMRFFMVPAMGHGPGTNGAENINFDALSVVEQWKQTGKAPDQLIVAHYKNGTEVGKRVVCEYPQVAQYKGSGNTEETDSYACR
jgi:feruloyl esterase